MRAQQQPPHPLGGSTCLGNGRAFAGPAVIPVSFPIAKSEKKAELRGMSMLGRREMLFSLSMRRDGWHNPFFFFFFCYLPHPTASRATCTKQELGIQTPSMSPAQCSTWSGALRKSSSFIPHPSSCTSLQHTVFMC